jgi:hypothetical protein
MPFQHFPKENVIFKNARISIPTTRVFGKYPRVRQICPQMEKLGFLETWKVNWGSAKATNHCGTFNYLLPVPQCHVHSGHSKDSTIKQVNKLAIAIDAHHSKTICT